MIDIDQTNRAKSRFSENFRAHRVRSGLSQVEVGTRAELHWTEVSKIELVQRVPRLTTIVKLAGAVDTPPSDLFEGLSWEIDPARRWHHATRPQSEMATVLGEASVWVNGGWVRVER